MGSFPIWGETIIGTRAIIKQLTAIKQKSAESR